MRFSLGVAAILLLSYFLKPGEGVPIHTERSFFGVHRVTRKTEGGFHWLIHGRTIHGVQSLDPEQRKVPLSYYHPTGPLGQVFDTYRAELTGPVAGWGWGGRHRGIRPERTGDDFLRDRSCGETAGRRSALFHLPHGLGGNGERGAG
ncbi:MAG: hypothetical protein HC814_05405 [Rhodobacteraceae bacterium]|nr:hypothetical protein [Paracoccaceae bacterium]